MLRARGNERLSDKKLGEPKKSSHADKKAGAARATKKRSQRGSDVGRALRSVYDETLRESVPDDFMDLLGKLS